MEQTAMRDRILSDHENPLQNRHNLFYTGSGMQESHPVSVV
jgi:hypothetical protein